MSKDRKNDALSKVLINPRFLEIQSPILRAEFIEGEWDKRGFSNEKKDALTDELGRMYMTDQFVLPNGQLWKAWRLDRKTWDARLLRKGVNRESGRYPPRGTEKK